MYAFIAFWEAIYRERRGRGKKSMTSCMHRNIAIGRLLIKKRDRLVPNDNIILVRSMVVVL